MAVKSKLETSFTGNDKHFQATANRVQKSGARLKKMASGIGAAFAALGGVMLIRGTVTKFDRIDKIATRMGMSAEKVHKLAYAAKISGASIEQLQGILTRLRRRVGEALDPVHGSTSAAAKGFQALGLNAKELEKLSPEEQLFAVADAFKASGNSAEGTAALMKILDTEVRELIPLFLQGGEGIKQIMNEITSPTEQTVKELARLNDMMTRISESGFATLAAGIGKTFKALEDFTFLIAENIYMVEAFFNPKMSMAEAEENIKKWREHRKKEEADRLAAQAKRQMPGLPRLPGEEEPAQLTGLKATKSFVSGNIFSPSSSGGFFGHGAAAMPSKFPGLTELQRMQDELIGLRTDIKESLR